jgi:hypothetical protein
LSGSITETVSTIVAAPPTPAATPTAAAPAPVATKKAATQLAASTDAVTLAKAFVAKYDAAVVAYLISQKSRVYNDVPALVKPFVAAEWSTLVALINYSTPVIAEAFFAAMEDAIGNQLTQLATGLVEDAVGAVAPVAAPVAANPAIVAPSAPFPLAGPAAPAPLGAA